MDGYIQCSFTYQRGAVLLFQIEPQIHSSIYTCTIYTDKTYINIYYIYKYMYVYI